MRILGAVEPRVAPAEMVVGLLKGVQEVLGSGDPWRDHRDRWLLEMQEAESGLRSLVESDPDPLGRSLLISARCNVFANEILQSKSIREDLRRLGVRPGDPQDHQFVHDERERFEESLAKAGRILFLHDTAPELVADKVLIEQLHRQKPGIYIRSVVKSDPLLMCASHSDAAKIALEGGLGADEILIDHGAGLGVVLEEDTGVIREAVGQADLIVAKGAAHYQMLSGSDLRVFSLLRAKCPVTAAAQNCRIGDLLFVQID